mmetsp:Transcript_22383/g.36138  ORF Transcript_22383/g.36138 Transcript_22383/m.36138 type:complete len:85 (+) Transcript_22383:643-897(+)
MANGSPGNPPPVPTSHTRCPGANGRNEGSSASSNSDDDDDKSGNGAKLGRMCLPKTTSLEQSFLETRLTREFQSLTSTASFASC